MKHLKRINEEFDQNIKEYIETCFLEISDDPNIDYESNIHGSGKYFKIKAALVKPDITGNPYVGTYDTTIERLLNQSNILTDLYTDIDIALKRVKDEYNIFYTLKSDVRGSVHINFEID